MTMKAIVSTNLSQFTTIKSNQDKYTTEEVDNVFVTELYTTNQENAYIFMKIVPIYADEIEP